MTRPRVPIPLAVQVPADLAEVLIFGPHAVLAILQHALLIGIEPLARQNPLSRVIEIASEMPAVEETRRLRSPQKSIQIFFAALRPGGFAASQGR